MSLKVGFDVETWKIIPGLLAPKLVVGSFAWRDNGEIKSELLLREHALARFRQLLESGAVLVIQNAPFDLAVMCAEDETLLPLVFRALDDGRILDPKIRQELIDIAAGRRQENGSTFVWRDGNWQKVNYDLASLVNQYTGRDRSAEKVGDSWRLKYSSLDGVPLEFWPEEAKKYALDDAIDALIVEEKQSHHPLVDPVTGLLPTEADQARAAWMLHLMSCWGVRTEAAAVERLKAELVEGKRKAHRAVARAGLFKFRRATREEVAVGDVDEWEPLPPKKDGTPREPRPLKYQRDTTLLRDIVRRTYEKQGRTVPATDKGAVATDKDALQESGSRLLAAVSELGGFDKIEGTYVPVLEQGTVVPINARFNVLVNSGRTSCSQPNLQNLPTGRRVGGVRECFTARPGYWLLSVDYDTLELRALAQRCLELFGYSKLAETIRQGLDIHSWMASNILGCAYEQIETNRKSKGPEKGARDLAKVADFGVPGGMGAESLVEFARKSADKIRLEKYVDVRHDGESDHAAAVRKAWELKNKFLAAAPEMRDFFRWVGERVGETDATFIDPVTGYVRGGVGYCDGCNHQFQHRAAFGAKAAGYELARECYLGVSAVGEPSPLAGSRLIAFVHDEYVLEVPCDVAHEASERVVRVMCDAMARVIPDVPVTASPALMTRWYKDAKERYSESGRLLPWA